MPFVEFTVESVRKPKVLVNTAHIVRVEPHPHVAGALVYTTPKGDGSRATGSGSVRGRRS